MSLAGPGIGSATEFTAAASAAAANPAAAATAALSAGTGAAAGTGLLAAAQAWIMNPMNVATIALVLFQGFASAKAKKKAQREAASRSIQGRPTGAGQDVPILYGYTGVEALNCYTNTGRHFPWKPSSGNLIGGLRVQDDGNQEYEFLLAQYVLSAGEIDGITAVIVNKSNVNQLGAQVQIHEMRHGQRPSDINPDGTLKAGVSTAASEMARAFAVLRSSKWDEDDPIPSGDGGERTSLSRYAGMTYMSSVYEQLTSPKDKRLQFGNAVPQPFVLGRGRTVRSVIRSGAGTEADPYKYAFSMVETFSRNWFLCYADYLTHPVYGPGLPDSVIDLPSLYAAAEVAGTTVQGPGSRLGGRAATAISEEFANLVRTTLGLGAGVTVTNDHVTQYYARQGRGFTGMTANPNFGVNPNVQAPPDLQRWEFNGKISSNADFPEALQIFEQVAPGVNVWFSKEGKVKFRAPDSETDEDAQVQLEIDRFVNEPTLSFPDSNQRATQYSVRYLNWLKEASEDSETFPSTGSALHEQLRARNGGRDLFETFEAAGIKDKWAARSWAANRIFQDERPFVSFTVGIVGLLIEPGDILRLKPPISGLDLIVKVLSPPVTNPDYTHDIEAVVFDKDDYAWTVNDAERVDFQNITPTTMQAPAGLTITFNAENKELAIVVNRPTDADGVIRPNTAILSYVIEVQEQGAADPPWVSLATLLAGGNLRYVYVPPFKQATYRYRVASRGISEQSDWVESSAVPIDGRISGLAAGTTAHFLAIAPGGCPERGFGRTGDIIIDANSSAIWEKRPDLFDNETVGSAGLIARANGRSLSFEGGNRWHERDPIALPASALTNPPGFVTAIDLDRDPGNQHHLNIGETSAATTPLTSAQFKANNAPLDSAGVEGQVASRASQSWRKGRGVFSDELDVNGARTGILARWRGVAATRDRSVSRSLIAQGLTLFVPDELTLRSDGRITAFRLRASNTSGSVKRLARLNLDTGAPDATPEGDDFKVALEPHLWIVLRNGTDQIAIPVGGTGAGRDQTEPYRWQWDASRAAEIDGWINRWGGEGGSTYSLDPNEAGPAIDIALVDARRRDLSDVNNRWFKVAATEVADFNADLTGSVMLAFRATATSDVQGNRGSKVEQATLIGGRSAPGSSDPNTYNWADGDFSNFLRFNFLDAAIPDADIAFIDVRRRCAPDPLNPWVRFDFARGQDGAGQESIFLTSADETRPVPPAGWNDWAFDSPVAPWHDGVVGLSADRPFVWTARRRVTGNPASGAPKQGDWGDWAIDAAARQWGEDGEPGIDGTPGLPGTSRLFFMNKRVTGRNPNAAGEYRWLRRNPDGTPRPTTQADVESWQELRDGWDYTAPGATESVKLRNFTLRLCPVDAEGLEHLDYLAMFFRGAITTWATSMNSTDGDFSQWMDFREERGSSASLVDVEQRFNRDAQGNLIPHESVVNGQPRSNLYVGFHLERIESKSPETPAFPAANADDEVAFMFSWAGETARRPAPTTEEWYLLNATKPARPARTAAGTAPRTGSRAWADSPPQPSATQDVWRVERANHGTGVAEFSEPIFHAGTLQTETYYGRHADRPTGTQVPPNNLAWGTHPSLRGPAGDQVQWLTSNPGAYLGDALWRIDRERQGVSQDITDWTLTEHEPAPGTTPTRMVGTTDLVALVTGAAWSSAADPDNAGRRMALLDLRGYVSGGNPYVGDGDDRRFVGYTTRWTTIFSGRQKTSSATRSRRTSAYRLTFKNLAVGQSVAGGLARLDMVDQDGRDFSSQVYTVPSHTVT